MKSLLFVLPALGPLVSASPLEVRQELDLALLPAVATSASIPIGPTADTVHYDLAAATLEAITAPLKVNPASPFQDTKGGLVTRSPCDLQPPGQGPVITPDTDVAFQNSSDLAVAAEEAQVPFGYQQTFRNLQASNNAYGYMGYITLDSYDTTFCASHCDATEGCLGFNIFFERDPSIEPHEVCPNPVSTTVIKCTLWGGYVAAENAQNAGQWRNEFHVVIAGSNGYQKTDPMAVSGFVGQALGNYAINAPLNCEGEDTYMGVKFFHTTVFNPNLCAVACSAENDYDTATSADPRLCKFFTTYLLSVNGVPRGQYCALYTQYWSPWYAVNNEQYVGSDHHTVTYAYSYVNATSDGVPSCAQL
ncbi:hypothetical protein F4780DRAFT_770969 [Xylariomycetidae sp. FL0641]|nr:hypothetical protein F4780DRAFT_770969 [Xylariomycetidae sp. FL0641]